jgi:FMN phosphatase YigB (HAD superfamily)
VEVSSGREGSFESTQAGPDEATFEPGTAGADERTFERSKAGAGDPGRTAADRTRVSAGPNVSVHPRSTRGASYLRPDNATPHRTTHTTRAAEVEAILCDLDDTLYPQAAWLDGAWRAVAAAGARYGIDEAAFLAALQADSALGSARGGIINRALAAVGVAWAAPAVEVGGPAAAVGVGGPAAADEHCRPGIASEPDRASDMRDQLPGIGDQPATIHSPGADERLEPGGLSGRPADARDQDARGPGQRPGMRGQRSGEPGQRAGVRGYLAGAELAILRSRPVSVSDQVADIPDQPAADRDRAPSASGHGSSTAAWAEATSPLLNPAPSQPASTAIAATNAAANTADPPGTAEDAADTATTDLVAPRHATETAAPDHPVATRNAASIASTDLGAAGNATNTALAHLTGTTGGTGIAPTGLLAVHNATEVAAAGHAVAAGKPADTASSDSIAANIATGIAPTGLVAVCNATEVAATGHAVAATIPADTAPADSVAAGDAADTTSTVFAAGRTDIPAADLIARLVAVFRAHRPARLEPYPGVREALARLRVAGVRLAVVTDGDVDVQAWKVRALGLSAFFECVVVSDALGGRAVRKPHAAPFLAALEGLGVGPGRCVVIGDRPEKDVTGAVGVDIRAIRVKTGEYQRAADVVGTWHTAADFPGAVDWLLQT